MAASPARNRWLFCAFFVALSGLFGWYAWSQASAHWRLATRGQRTEALIVGYDEVRGRRSTTTYPVFQFVTADGRRMRATSGVSADPGQSARGSRITVVYDPGRPETVQQAVAVDGGMGFTPWFLGGLSVLMSALASIFLLPQRRKPEATT